MSDECWQMLRELMTAVDVHRLVTTEPDEHDIALYNVVTEMRRRLA